MDSYWTYQKNAFDLIGLGFTTKNRWSLVLFNVGSALFSMVAVLFFINENQGDMLRITEALAPFLMAVLTFLKAFGFIQNKQKIFEQLLELEKICKTSKSYITH